ncbi:uncharacterized protein PV09_05354 [Verruconis gallopava]|uniref:Uncharacterized protein n=1 Tax=Verruconis gallopava TaxID=253628 RepID=A0A0D1XMB2_9PEZI|nr:uncharacterized protein PV09_05354 [Verruconis gallopava]KIW03601.1 hypothetical protein PV09_05354 [Verruconis gallopava]
MDAKPQRLRAAPRLRDENALPTSMVTSKTLYHNRTKSTPALSSLLKNPVKTNASVLGGATTNTNSFGLNVNTNSNSTLSNARQRSAFADVSNTRLGSRSITVKDDMSIVKDGHAAPMGKTFSTLQPLKEVPDANVVPHANKQPALLRPAQRPLNAAQSRQVSAPQANHAGNDENVVAPGVQKSAFEPIEHRSSDPDQLLKNLNRKRTTIFREAQPAAEQENQGALLKEPVKPLVTSNALVHQVLDASRDKKLPAIPEPVVPTVQALLPAIEQARDERVNFEQEVKDFSRELIESIEQTFARAEEHIAPSHDNEVDRPEPEKSLPMPVLPSRSSSQDTIPQVEPASRTSDQEVYQLALETQLPPVDSVLDSSKLPLSAHSDYPEYLDEEEDDEEEYYDAEGYTTARSIRSRGDNTTGGLTTIIEPRVTQRVLKELEAARDYVLATRTEDDIEDEAWDTSMVAEYGDDIFEYMRKLESKMRPNEHYMDNQNEIQWSMRSVLMDWMVQVHARFGLLPETLFLAVNYIDRFLSCKVVSLGKLQLVGATALFVAAKYEEINCPSVQEIVYMVDNAYTVDEILKAERFMLSMLQFELGWPGPMSFLRRISKADEYDLDTRTMAKYFLEVMIMDERFVACPPSFASAGAHCLSRLVLDKGDWTLAHTYYSQYTYWQLHDLLAKLVECCQQPRKHHQAVFEKYREKKYKRCSVTAEEKLTSPSFKLPPKNAGRESAGTITSNWQNALWKRF